MRIAMVGMGKLGWPVSLAMAKAGHDVTGYDISEKVVDAVNSGEMWTIEAGMQEYIDSNPVRCKLISDCGPGELEDYGIVFVAVQTPHEKRYEGITPMPEQRKDFNYEHLRNAVKWVAKSIAGCQYQPIVAVISTCLPGTIEPIFDKNLIQRPIYTPSFIAMGTVLQDFENPEFYLVGARNLSDRHDMSAFYATISNRPMIAMPIRDAELTKVAYNTFISTKLGMLGALTEVADRNGCDIDAIMGALTRADKRLMGPAYLRAGMGDGGGCHPRDNIAMSWLAQQSACNYDWFEHIIVARERHAEWFATVIRHYHIQTELPVLMYGYAFKPDTAITTGSHALLVANILSDKLNISASLYDPVIGGDVKAFSDPAVIFIGCAHSAMRTAQFPDGSIVIDPNGIIPSQINDVDVIKLGRRRR